MHAVYEENGYSSTPEAIARRPPKPPQCVRRSLATRPPICGTDEPSCSCALTPPTTVAKMRSYQRCLLALVVLAVALSVPALAKKKKGDPKITNKVTAAGAAARNSEGARRTRLIASRNRN